MPDRRPNRRATLCRACSGHSWVGRLLVNHSPYWPLWPLGCENFLYGLFQGHAFGAPGRQALSHALGMGAGSTRERHRTRSGSPPWTGRGRGESRHWGAAAWPTALSGRPRLRSCSGGPPGRSGGSGRCRGRTVRTPSSRRGRGAGSHAGFARGAADGTGAADRARSGQRFDESRGGHSAIPERETIETHLSNIYRKLGLHRRSELAALFARERLTSASSRI